MGRRRSCSSRGSSLRRGLWDSGSTFSGGCLRLSSFEISVPKGHIYYHYGNRSQKTILIMTLGTYKIPFCIHIHIYIYIYTYTYIHIYIYICLYIYISILYHIISFHITYIYTHIIWTLSPSGLLKGPDLIARSLRGRQHAPPAKVN